MRIRIHWPPPAVLCPHASIQRPIPNRLGNILRFDVVVPFEIRDRPRHAEHLIVCSGRQTQVFHGRFQKRHGLGLERTELQDLARSHPAVDLRPFGPEPLGLASSGLKHLRTQVGRVGPGGISASWVNGTAGTSTWRSMRSSTGLEILLKYFSTCGGVQLQARLGSDRKPHGHAFIPEPDEVGDAGPPQPLDADELSGPQRVLALFPARGKKVSASSIETRAWSAQADSIVPTPSRRLLRLVSSVIRALAPERCLRPSNPESSRVAPRTSDSIRSSRPRAEHNLDYRTGHRSNLPGSSPLPPSPACRVKDAEPASK